MTLSERLEAVRACRLCEPDLPLGANPVVQMAHGAKLLIIGQAPGTKVHHSSLPWNDASGERLREWLQITRDDFYDPNKVAIMPMGFCYPGKGRSGDLPPRKECAPAWHASLRAELPHIALTLLIGQYAQRYYMANKPKTLTDTVRLANCWPENTVALPHPSPRNQLWLKKNPWFEQQTLPILRAKMAALKLSHTN